MDRKPDGRALLVGSPGKNLKGVDHDVSRMAEMLRGRGFVVDVRLRDRATRDGILEGYNELINCVQPGETAVIYYAGHGFRAFAEQQSAWWQGIAPTDLDATTTDDFRGITAWELSIKLAQLTARTTNVTVIIDACYASQMSRGEPGSDAVARALPHPVRLGFDAHLRALQAEYGDAFTAVDPLGNPDAVQLVACAKDESAFEYTAADGQRSGVFTDALLEVLSEVRDAPVSWEAIGDAIRGRVLRRFTVQHPEIGGPIHRQLFSLAPGSTSAAVAISEVSGGYQFEAGSLLGVSPGDMYCVMPPGPPSYRCADAVAELLVRETSATRATAVLCGWRNGHSELPANAFAVLIEKAAVRRAVRVVAAASELPAIAAAIDATRALRVADAADDEIATLRLTGDTLSIEDRLGRLFPAAGFPADLARMVDGLVHLGAAQGLRELAGEHGVSASEVDIEWGTVDRDQPRVIPESGGIVALLDRLYVRVHRHSTRSLYVHVFNIGLSGRIKLLTRFAPAGVELTESEPEFVLGQRPDRTLEGLSLGWPDDLLREPFPRIDEIAVIVTSEPASLQGLESMRQRAVARAPGSKLQELLVQVQDGLSRDLRAPTAMDGYFMKRLWCFLYPVETVLADLPFDVDDNPLRQVAEHGSSAQASSGNPAPPACERALSVQITDVMLENSELIAAEIRIDALICTRSTEGAWRYSASTRRCRGGNLREPIPLDRPTVFCDPVQDFIELYVWVTHAPDGRGDLEELLEQRSLAPDCRGAILLLAGDAVRSRRTAAIAWSAMLSRMAYEVLGSTEATRGVFRTSWQSCDGFGIGRHFVRAEQISFSLLVEHLECGRMVGP